MVSHPIILLYPIALPHIPSELKFSISGTITASEK